MIIIYKEVRDLTTTASIMLGYLKQINLTHTTHQIHFNLVHTQTYTVSKSL